jgi:hypothetical protein
MMVNIERPEAPGTEKLADADAVRMQAQADFSAALDRMVRENAFGRRFATTSELEIMEAATAITLKK